MPGNVHKYAFINAKLRTRISMLLSDQAYLDMSRAGSVSEAIAVLRNTRYAPVAATFDRTGDIRSCELSLFEAEMDLIQEIEKYLSEEVLDLVHALAARYEIENIKHALRLWFERHVRGEDIADEVGYLSTAKSDLDLHKLAGSETLLDILAELQGTAYAEILRKTAESIEIDHSLFRFETELDRFYYAALIRAIDSLTKTDKEVTLRLIGIEIDLVNINSLIRFRDVFQINAEEAAGYLIPKGYGVRASLFQQSFNSEDPLGEVTDIIRRQYPDLSPLLSSGQTDRLSRIILLERLLNEMLEIEIRRVLGGNPFTVGIILSYFLLMQRETRRLISVLNGVSYQLDGARIRALI